MSVILDVMLVPYGTDSWAVQGIVVQRFNARVIRLETGFPCATINKMVREPLRLNSESSGLRLEPDVLQDGSPFELLREQLKKYCRPWDRLSLRFLDRYFDHIADMVVTHRVEIDAKLAPFAGLYAAMDWVFSAPIPLPRAHLYAPRDGRALPSADDFVQVEFAFWLGDRMAAVLSQPNGLTPSKSRERVERLEQAGILTIDFKSDDLSGSYAALFERIIGDFGALLARSGPVPSGPFRPRALIE